jgi:hypothetical protein
MRVYSIQAYNLTVPGARTLAMIRPPASRPIRIRRVEVSCKDHATAAQQALQLVTQVSAFPTLSSVTPVPLDAGNAAAVTIGGTDGSAGTAGVNASAEGGGTRTVLSSHAFHTPLGFLWTPSDADDEIVLPAGSSSAFGVYLPAAPIITTGWCVNVFFAEG